MSNFQQYLTFDNEEKKQRQLEIFQQIQLSPQTIEAVKQIKQPQRYLLAVELFCPDCWAFVPVMEKIANLNPAIELHYLARSQFDDLSQFESQAEQQFVQQHRPIPGLFRRDNGKLELVYSEFPQVIAEKMAQEPEHYEQLKADYRAGKFTELVEKQVLASLLKG